jgi:tetratricopeptide (TPR) repeat protein
VSLKRLHAEAPAAQDLLSLCAFLAPDGIPHVLLHDHPDLLPEPLATAIRDPLAFGQALGALGGYALATITDEAISVHRLVQTVVRHALGADQATTWAAAAVALVAAAFPDRASDADTWPVATRLLAHAVTVTDGRVLDAPDPAATARLLHRVTDYLWARGEYAQAKPLAEHALALCERRLGAEHPETARSLNNLASILRAQGDLHGARALCERALAICEARLGPNHPNTATILSDLADILRDQGHVDQARRLHERALAIDEARLGADHPDTATSLTNLADVLRDQGHVDQARRLLERALSIREAHLGADHPVTVRTRHNLAAVVVALDKQQ